jgi:hypothetical protein
MQKKETMHDDITHKGKVYRIIGEPSSIAHPGQVIVAIFDISLPGKPEEMHRDTGTDDSKLETMMRNARVWVNNLS